MTFIADFLMLAGALAVAFYCMILSRRLRRLASLDDGMGAAVAVLSQQVEEMTLALERTRAAARGSAEDLGARTARAEAAVSRLELLMAALADLPDATAPPAGAPAAESGAGGRRTGDGTPFVSRRKSLLSVEDAP